MTSPLEPLLLIGVVLFVGLLAGKGAYALKLPGLVGYILLGLLLSDSVSGLLSRDILNTLEMVTPMVLGIIGFTVGGQLGRDVFSKHGSEVFIILIFQTVIATLLVGGGIYLATSNLPMALILGPLASATAPAATLNVLWENRAKGPLTTMIMAIVALDDGVAIILFGLGESIALSIHSGSKQTLMQVMGPASLEVAGGILLGVLSGVAIGLLLQKVNRPHTALIASLGLIFITAGTAQTLHISLMLATLVSGMVALNIATVDVAHLLKNLEDVTPPLYLLFFVLVGAELDIKWLANLEVIGLLFIVLRVAGKWAGSWLGALVSGADWKIRRYLGPALFSQAGVAIGLSLVVLQDFSQLGPEGVQVARTIVNLVAATTLLMELVGPVLVKKAVVMAGEAHPDEA